MRSCSTGLKEVRALATSLIDKWHAFALHPQRSRLPASEFANRVLQRNRPASVRGGRQLPGEIGGSSQPPLALTLTRRKARRNN